MLEVYCSGNEFVSMLQKSSMHAIHSLYQFPSPQNTATRHYKSPSQHSKRFLSTTTMTSSGENNAELGHQVRTKSVSSAAATRWPMKFLPGSGEVPEQEHFHCVARVARYIHRVGVRTMLRYLCPVIVASAWRWLHAFASLSALRRSLGPRERSRNIACVRS